ncbi:MAG: hypothetical protein M1840_006754, partial [Geoglossum simile]
DEKLQLIRRLVQCTEHLVALLYSQANKSAPDFDAESTEDDKESVEEVSSGSNREEVDEGEVAP